MINTSNLSAEPDQAQCSLSTGDSGWVQVRVTEAAAQLPPIPHPTMGGTWFQHLLCVS